MGSRFDITVVAVDSIEANKNINLAINEISRIERLISSWDKNSQTSEINRNAGINPIKVDKELFNLIERALGISKLTDGAFDISYASMDRIWKFDGSMEAMPTKQEVNASVSKVGFKNIILDKTNSTVFLKNKGMKIGFGAIGQEVAKIATAFGAEVSYHSTSGKNLHHGYPHQSLEFILRDCDIISIHAPLNDDTYNLINEINLPYMKDDAILLNLGRGGIINETDLAFELDRRALYAGLDVLEKEPMSINNRLNEVKHKERLLITPHMAWTSIEARKKLLEGIVDNIRTFMEK